MEGRKEGKRSRMRQVRTSLYVHIFTLIITQDASVAPIPYFLTKRTCRTSPLHLSYPPPSPFHHFHSFPPLYSSSSRSNDTAYLSITPSYPNPLDSTSFPSHPAPPPSLPSYDACPQLTCFLKKLPPTTSSPSSSSSSSPPNRPCREAREKASIVPGMLASSMAGVVCRQRGRRRVSEAEEARRTGRLDGEVAAAQPRLVCVVCVCICVFEAEGMQGGDVILCDAKSPTHVAGPSPHQKWLEEELGRGVHADETRKCHNLVLLRYYYRKKHCFFLSALKCTITHKATLPSFPLRLEASLGEK